MNEHEIEPAGNSTTSNKDDFTLVRSDNAFNEGKDAFAGDENTLNEAVSTAVEGLTTWVS